MSTMTVAKYLEQQIAVCGKSQRELAEACGYPKPNIMTMFKTGATKLPLTTVAPMARALEVDPGHLLRLVMTEYMPEAWQAIETMMGTDRLMTESERRLLQIVRRTTAGHELNLARADNVLVIESAVRSIVSGDKARARASVTALNETPRHMRPKSSDADPHDRI